MVCSLSFVFLIYFLIVGGEEGREGGERAHAWVLCIKKKKRVTYLFEFCFCGVEKVR